MTMDDSKRDFLFRGLVLGALWSVGAALTWIFGSVWTATGRFSSAGWIQVSSMDRFSPGTITPFPEYRVAIVHSGRKIGAISLECTHLGCLVNVVDRGFFCPCHGSDFGPLGQVYSGPAIRPLPWYEVADRGGRLWVRLGEKLTTARWIDLKEPGGATGRTT
jgi:cytochrome b6-f complex iron-sulfur subunit